MFKELFPTLEKPAIYTKTKIPFWDDEYISKQMLKAHLNPEFEGASRKLEFINKSVAWIKEIAAPSEYWNLLDVGCGPGIYAEKFAMAGYKVTGIDFSKRSINYAIESAMKNKIDIRYFYQNYLNMDLDLQFDFATMIYCDYGALSTKDRKILMKAVYRHLRKGGRFLLDVFSVEKYHCFEERTEWEICRNGGFWREEEYIALSGCYKYPNNVTLEQTSVISHTGIDTYYVWNTCFTKETLIREIEEAGFKVCGIFGDVAGKKFNKESLTIAVLLEK